MPPPGVRTEGLIEVVTAPLGPRAATAEWSYPDFVDLRAADPGIALAGWAGWPTKTAIQTPAGVETKPIGTMFVSANYFKTIGVALARGPGFDPAMDVSTDYDLCLRLSEHYPIAHLPRPLYRYRIRKDSISQGSRLRQVRTSFAAAQRALERRGMERDYAFTLGLRARHVLRPKPGGDPA